MMWAWWREATATTLLKGAPTAAIAVGSLGALHSWGGATISPSKTLLASTVHAQGNMSKHEQR